jgi:ABC-type Fe3+-siderophore transport system permease subunit
MTKTGSAALVAAVLISAFSIASAILIGLTGQPIIDPEAGSTVALAALGLLLTLTYLHRSEVQGWSRPCSYCF